MRAAWRLAISSLWAGGRRRRAALLASAAALSCALVVGVACAMESVHAAINKQLAVTVGSADLRVRPAGSGSALPASVLGTVRGWPEVARAEARAQGAVMVTATRPVLAPGAGEGAFRRKDMAFTSAALALSLSEGADEEGALLPAPELMAGRLPGAADEVVLDDLLAYRLTYSYATAPEHRDGFFLPGGGEDPRAPVVPEARPEVPERLLAQTSPPAPEEAGVRRAPAGELAHLAERINRNQGVAVGDEVEVARQSVLPGFDLPGLRRSTRLKVVGIAAMPPLGGRPQAYLTLEGLQRVTGSASLSQIDIGVREGVDPEATARARRAELPKGLLLETTQKVTAGLQKNIQSNQLGMVLATVMAFLSASFIILTGLGTAVVERQRELAIVRCIGGTRGQLAGAQLVIGVVIGAAGAVAGVPLGIALAWALSLVFGDQLPTGLAVSWWAAGLGAAGSVVAGIAGAAWPAVRAARVSPLIGLAARAAPAKRRGLAAVTLVGLAFVAAQLVLISASDDGQVLFWGYATAGLPLMSVGYFLLGVPAILVVTRVAAGGVSRVLGVPGTLLARTVSATPYRHGLTAGALMAGLALMVSIWTNGGSMLRDWLDKIRFPDAFVSGLALPESAQRKLESLDVVAETCAITLTTVETDLFGVRALQRYKTTFVGFEPEPFFGMTRLVWVQGDEAEAVRRLKEGGAVIVAREFLTAQGLGVGHRFTCRYGEREHDFEIVGVVASPGLEIVSKFFNVGEDFTDQAVHAVFGSRADMKARFFGGEQAPVHLIQIQFADGAVERGAPA
ncbi:MAG: FtsX-like permease family protein [Phycisphaerales bacterium]